jgi:hypothetical protein
MRTFAIVLHAFVVGQGALFAANAGIDSTGASMCRSSGANGDGATMSKMKSAPDAATPGAPRSSSQSTERRGGLWDKKSDCAKTGCVDSN